MEPEQMMAACPTGEDEMSPSSLKLYEAQFFGFTPQTCMIRVYSAFHDCLCDILLVVEEVCVRRLNNAGRNEEEQLRSSAREYTQKMQQFFDKRFERLSGRMESILVNNCLSIPPNVLLPDDEPHRKYTRGLQDGLKLEASLAELHAAYQAEVCARQALLAELEEQRAVREQLEGVRRWVAELQAAWVKEGMGSFHDSFRQAMESVSRLQDAVGHIGSQTPH